MRKTSYINPEDRNIRLYEWGFQLCLKAVGILMVLLLVFLLATILRQSWPSIQEYGLQFYTGRDWDPVFKNYSAIPFIAGTLATTLLSLAISVPIAISLAIFAGFYVKSKLLATMIRTLIDLLAGIPSVIYGFWGLFVLVPLIRKFELATGIIPYGVGIFAAAIILAIMIVPYAAAIGRDVISLVPNDLKEAGLALGATPYEVVVKIILPYAKSGLLSGILLSFGRAIGETMAVTMVIGNANKIPSSIFSPANTLSSVIANEFAEATNALYISNLVHLGLILFATTTLIGFIGRIVIRKWSVDQ
jgi:phosphate transport system permease protein